MYPPSLNGGATGGGGSAGEVLTADGRTVQSVLDELKNEIDILERDKLYLEILDD